MVKEESEEEMKFFIELKSEKFTALEVVRFHFSIFKYLNEYLAELK